MNILVAADKNWAIGNKGQLLVTIPGDQKLFREETLGKVVVMGRKTFESLPGRRPLPGRTNVILTKELSYSAKGAVICHSLKDAAAALFAYRPEDIYIIGGQQIYEQFLPYCSVVHATCIDYIYHADTYFPNLEKSPDWELTAESDEQTYFDICYEFRMYQRKGKIMTFY